MTLHPMSRAYLTLAMLILMEIRCGGRIDTEGKSMGTPSIRNEIKDTAICIWPSSPLLQLPNESSLEIGSIPMGEQVTLMRESNLSNNRTPEFSQILVHDSTVGWVHSRILAVGATAAAVKNSAMIFSLPDADTWTGKTFSTLDFVGVKRRIDADWIEVIGRQGLDSIATSGWLKQSDISENEIDVAFSKDYKTAMEIDDLVKRTEALEKILCIPAYSTSIFYSYLSGQIRLDI